jgi:serine/threonine-protein kinase 24/25/MST4
MAKRAASEPADAADVADASALERKLRGGGRMLKHGRLGKPHLVHVWCSEDMLQLLWGEKAGDARRARSLAVTGLRQVLRGAQTKVFAASLARCASSSPSSPHGRPHEPVGAFSLVFAERTLDLEAEDAAARDAWLEAFEWLLRLARRASSGLPYNVQHTTHVDAELKWSSAGAACAVEDLELQEKLGEGAFGEVFRARHRQGRFTVAVKVVAPEAGDAEALKSEIDILRSCRHPCIVSYYGCLGPDDEGRLWILMDLCALGSLAHALRDTAADTAAMGEEQIAYVCHGVLMALAYLHGKGVTHGDVKCANLLLSELGEVKVADFGVSHRRGAARVGEAQGEAAAEGDEQEEAAEEEQRGLCGSPLWMAPELLSTRTSSCKVDVWALGISCLEMAERRLPHASMPALRAMRAIVAAPPPRLEGARWSANFRDFVARCLQKDPASRPSAMELLAHPFFTNRNLNASVMAPLVAALRGVAATRSATHRRSPSLLSRFSSFLSQSSFAPAAARSDGAAPLRPRSRSASFSSALASNGCDSKQVQPTELAASADLDAAAAELLGAVAEEDESAPALATSDSVLVRPSNPRAQQQEGEGEPAPGDNAAEEHSLPSDSGGESDDAAAQSQQQQEGAESPPSLPKQRSVCSRRALLLASLLATLSAGAAALWALQTRGA